MKQYIGLGKTLYNSSLCFIPQDNSKLPSPEIFLSERFERVKSSGKSPIYLASDRLSGHQDLIAESADVVDAEVKEKIFNERFPFYEHVSLRRRESFLSQAPGIVPVGHHLAHAYAAVLRSPFPRALVVVMDGAGSSSATLFKQAAFQEIFHEKKDLYEHLSVYGFENGKLSNLRKEFMQFKRSGERSFGSSPGIFYEMISKYIFNSQTDPGKVMGLAPFGEGKVITDFLSFQENLGWKSAFTGKSKAEWEKNPSLSTFQDLAATAQMSFENYFLSYLKDLKKQFPDYDQLILTGGCALNCTANWKLVREKLFSEIYVCPFPGDESIGLGCASAMWFKENQSRWEPLPWNKQNSFLGPEDSKPTDEKIAKIFEEFELTYEKDIARLAARSIADGEVVAWFQGRSESGPRALGHRSILARPDRNDLKNYLNEKIKFRESFRPYGCTVKEDSASNYFDCSPGFKNPFMSFAVPVRSEFKEKLQHVTHVDGTSRMQTLHPGQDPLFYDLLNKVEELIGIPVVLHTSLNVMNEPIVESLEDALRFFKTTPVDALFAGNFMIRKKSHV